MKLFKLDFQNIADKAFRELANLIKQFKDEFQELKNYTFELQKKNLKLMIEKGKLKIARS